MLKPKLYQEKKVYSKPHNGVFMACQLALMRLKCNVTESGGNYFFARIGSSRLLGYSIELNLIERSDKKIEVKISSKSSPLMLFGNPKRIMNKIFKKIDKFLMEEEK